MKQLSQEEIEKALNFYGGATDEEIEAGREIYRILKKRIVDASNEEITKAIEEIAEKPISEILAWLSSDIKNLYYLDQAIKNISEDNKTAIEVLQNAYSEMAREIIEALKREEEKTNI